MLCGSDIDMPIPLFASTPIWQYMVSKRERTESHERRIELLLETPISLDSDHFISCFSQLDRSCFMCHRWCEYSVLSGCHRSLLVDSFNVVRIALSQRGWCKSHE